MEKDIVLILQSGGMMGIFTAGVLEEIHAKYKDRIHSIYGSSSGADVGVYFLSNQSHIPYTFFTKYLASKKFIRGNIFLYALKVFFFKKSSIPDFVDMNYVRETAENSECALDVRTLSESDIQFYIKAIDIRTASATYFSAQPCLFEKLIASSQTGPFSSKAIQIDGAEYIDGGTLPPTIELDVVRSHPDKTIIFVESNPPSVASKILLYPFHLIAAAALSTLYGKKIGRCYIQKLFTNSTKKLCSFDNVVHIQNKKSSAGFTLNKRKLDIAYTHGRSMGRSLAL